MKYVSISLLTLALAGCANAPRPQMNLLAPRAPIIKAAPAPAVVAPAPDKPATFKERFITFRKKHPITWTHRK